MKNQSQYFMDNYVQCQCLKAQTVFFRKRCGIPVIIMGETGCGKTRLIRFMCEVQAGPDGPKNLLLMKVGIYDCLLFFVP